MLGKSVMPRLKPTAVVIGLLLVAAAILGPGLSEVYATHERHG